MTALKTKYKPKWKSPRLSRISRRTIGEGAKSMMPFTKATCAKNNPAAGTYIKYNKPRRCLIHLLLKGNSRQKCKNRGGSTRLAPRSNQKIVQSKGLNLPVEW